VIDLTPTAITELERFAYGPLALKPWELARLTPAEFTALAEGWQWRHERSMEVVAWGMAYLMAPHSKQRLNPEKFIQELIGDAAYARRKEAHKAQQLEIIEARKRKREADAQDGAE
jgi:hypothetical protein